MNELEYGNKVMKALDGCSSPYDFSIEHNRIRLFDTISDCFKKSMSIKDASDIVAIEFDFEIMNKN